MLKNKLNTFVVHTAVVQSNAGKSTESWNEATLDTETFGLWTNAKEKNLWNQDTMNQRTGKISQQIQYHLLNLWNTKPLLLSEYASISLEECQVHVRGIEGAIDVLIVFRTSLSNRY